MDTDYLTSEILLAKNSAASATSKVTGLLTDIYSIKQTNNNIINKINTLESTTITEASFNDISSNQAVTELYSKFENLLSVLKNANIQGISDASLNINNL